MKYKIVRTLRDLRRGNIVRHRTGGPTYVVNTNFGQRVTAVASIDITNPEEWEVLADSQSTERGEQ